MNNKWPIKNKTAIITAFLISFTFYFAARAQDNSKRITIDDIYQNYTFYPKRISSFKSMNDGLSYTILTGSESIVKCDYETGNVSTTLFASNDTHISTVSEYEFSADEKSILLTTAKEEIYRRSFLADFYIYTIGNKNLIPLSKKGKQQLASFSPDGEKIAFVRDNNLFFTELASMKETQITFDGKKNVIINGAPDWVYEEEFALSKGFVWSPDSRKLAFYRFDESMVKDFNLTDYKNLYPESYIYKYPKAGEQNAKVSIHVFDLVNRQIIQMDAGQDTDQYIPRISWIKKTDILSIVRMNRKQNRMDILHSNSSTGTAELVYTEKNKDYVSEPTDDMISYLSDRKNFIIRSERDGWFHLYLYNYTSKTIKPITKGEFDVSAFLNFDENTETVYYLSHEISVLQQDVFAVSPDGKNKRRLSSGEGWNEAEFSKNFRHYLNYYSSVNRPDSISIHSSDGKLIRVLEDNDEIVKKMKDYSFGKIEFIKIPSGSKLELNGFILKPHGFDPAKKYPLFMYVYGGPESQTVIDKFRYGNIWLQMLTQKGYIVACVDGRGTGSRGETFRKSVFMELGKYETIDQIEAARYLGGLNYIDKSRIGIFGWSYGGFLSLLCLEMGSDVFKMAISVAPVTDWRFYDTIYTERFMRTPRENEKGYYENSPLNHVEKIKGKLLLVHGMKDDNVHMQNSVELIQKMIQNIAQFDMLFYPNRNHGIRDRNASVHLYTKMTDFVLENL